ncbi:hypothetical protein SHVI106290_02680 [Shewanella violacea]|uniref:Uncharacterized protein n=1 Tax=Shewanella violacea (strain JCM 10179 / CIP 106290 / LMG 19151 / DSS12) TaxID=637905 RepID=D4ZHA3_SHEVD|nr:hypothetical protein SVI_1081 [Shewanella violacea DSS12]
MSKLEGGGIFYDVNKKIKHMYQIDKAYRKSRKQD